MESIVYEETPLADYLKDGGDESEADWAPVDSSPLGPSSLDSQSSPPSSPSPFAPTGRPLVKARFRRPSRATEAPSTTLGAIRRSCSAAVAARIDHADNCKFLEQFRYTIIASQLLSGHLSGHRPAGANPAGATSGAKDHFISTEAIIASVLGVLAVAVIVSWARGSAPSPLTRKRVVFLLALIAASAFVCQVYVRRQWLRYRRQQFLSEIAAFVSNSHDFDSATEATLSLVQEVELVSRGYRISTPLPPITRLEDLSQNRRCVRLRRVLKNSFGDSLATYNHASNAVKAFSEQTELEKYYDMYDISDFDISDALQGFNEAGFADPESLRALKILAARFHTARRMLLCALLALDANGEGAELVPWTTAVEALQRLNTCTKASYGRLREIMREEESFPLPPPPKGPLTPGRERWRSQLRKLNSLSTGIRGLQAKLHLLREESDRALDDSNDISELGPRLMSQYESIGIDLRELMTAWGEGKAALALGIDRNEKRLSSMSTALSPAESLSGLTTMGEGGAEDALKALTGEPSSSPEPAEAEAPQVFEAVARARPRSLLTREERIVKVREDREQKAQARQQMDATRGVLRELEAVISRRPGNRCGAAQPEQVVSM